MQTDVAIIGAGPIGIFGAFQAGMLGMKSCIIDSLAVVGGQCSALYSEKPIYDIPAYPKIIAHELIDNLMTQASQFNPKYLLARTVNSLVLEEDNQFALYTSTGDIIKSRVVIIAAGAGCFGPNRPPLQDIEEYEEKSVFYGVATKDRFINKRIIIAGGGDSALDWALSLSSIAKVTIVHRRNKFKAFHASIQKIHQLLDQGKINLITNFQLSSLRGKNGVLEQVVVSDLDGNTKCIDADILLPFFGVSQSLGPLIDFGLDIKGYNIIAHQPYYETNIPGIYAVGDVVTYTGKLKLISTGFGEVVSALHHAYTRVFNSQPLHFEYSTKKFASVVQDSLYNQ